MFGLFKKTWQRDRKRGQRLCERGDLLGAMRAYHDSIDRFDGAPEELVDLNVCVEDLHRRLFNDWMEQAQIHAVSRDRERALAAIESARPHARRPELREVMQALLTSLTALEADSPEEAEYEMPTADRYEQFISVYELTDPVRGDMLVDYLRRSGFPARLIGTRSAALVGAGQLIMTQRIEVPQSRASEAFLLLDQLEGGAAAERGKLSLFDPTGKLSEVLDED